MTLLLDGRGHRTVLSHPAHDPRGAVSRWIYSSLASPKVSPFWDETRQTWPSKVKTLDLVFAKMRRVCLCFYLTLTLFSSLGISAECLKPWGYKNKWHRDVSAPMSPKK